MNEVMERVELIVSVQGSRRISSESLQFLYDKYELPEEERQAVLAFCRERGIAVFDELTPEEKAPAPKAAPAPKKSFFARLLGR